MTETWVFNGIRLGNTSAMIAGTCTPSMIAGTPNIIADTPISTHFLQPLDASVFGPLKQSYKKFLSEISQFQT